MFYGKMDLDSLVESLTGSIGWLGNSLSTRVDLLKTKVKECEVAEKKEEKERLKEEIREKRRKRSERRKRVRMERSSPHGMLTRNQKRLALMDEENNPRFHGMVHQARRHVKEFGGMLRCTECQEVKSHWYFDTQKGDSIKIKCISCNRMAGYKEDPLGWFIKYLNRESKTRARKKGIPHTVTPEILTGMFEAQEGKCYICGGEMTYEKADHRKVTEKTYRFARNRHNISLDQFEPSLGYTKSNVRLCHLVCNLMKNDLPLQDFIDICRAISAYNTKT